MYSSGHACLRGSGLSRQIRNGDEHSSQSGRLRRLCDAVRFLQQQNSARQSLQSQRPCGRLKANTPQRVRVCDHLDPMDRLEVEPLTNKNYAKLKGGSREWLPSSPGSHGDACAEGALLQSSSQTCRELTVAYHDTWWLLVRAKDQACGEFLALARATSLAAHKDSGSAAHTFDASWSEEFNAVASDDKFWAAQIRYLGLGLSGPLCEASSAARRRVNRVAVRACRPKPNRVRESAPASATVRDSTHSQELKDGTCRSDCNGYNICTEWSCSHDKCSDPCPRQLSHTCIRCRQLHRLASSPSQQKRKADRATKDMVAVREGHTLPRRQLVTPALWLPSRLRISLRCGPWVQRRRDTSRCTLSFCLLAMSATETLTNRWGRPWLLRRIISL